MLLQETGGKLDDPLSSSQAIGLNSLRISHPSKKKNLLTAIDSIVNKKRLQ